MLKLFDKYFTQPHKTSLTITNFHEIKIENLIKEITIMKKNQMETIEPINTITEINLLDELSSRAEVTENKIRKLEDRSIEFT